jgi:hypothetical protein
MPTFYRILFGARFLIEASGLVFPFHFSTPSLSFEPRKFGGNESCIATPRYEPQFSNISVPFFCRFIFSFL